MIVNWKSELTQWLPTVRCVYYVGTKVGGGEGGRASWWVGAWIRRGLCSSKFSLRWRHSSGVHHFHCIAAARHCYRRPLCCTHLAPRVCPPAPPPPHHHPRTTTTTALPQDERARKYAAEVQSLQFNVLVTTYEFIMRDRARLSKVRGVGRGALGAALMRWMLGAGCWVLGAGCWVLGAGR